MFDLDKGNNSLGVAFGITYYDSNEEMIVEPDYAIVRARVKSWGDDIGVKWKELELRPCTKEELGIGSPETLEQSKFYRPSFTSK